MNPFTERSDPFGVERSLKECLGCQDLGWMIGGEEFKPGG